LGGERVRESVPGGVARGGCSEAEASTVLVPEKREPDPVPVPPPDELRMPRAPPREPGGGIT
jgi:hypothetical protein